MSNKAVEVRIELGHRAVLREKPTAEGFTHDWTVLVRGPDGADIEHFVEKVVFLLHESFHKPKRVCKEPPYTVSESGYAGFNMPIDVYFRSKEEPRKVSYVYDLYLSMDGKPINNFRCERLTFRNPNEEFCAKLLRGGGRATSAIGTSDNGKTTPPLGSSSNSSKELAHKRPKQLNSSTSHSKSSSSSGSESKRPHHSTPTPPLIPPPAAAQPFTDLFGVPLVKGASGTVDASKLKDLSSSSNSERSKSSKSHEASSVKSSSSSSSHKKKDKHKDKEKAYKREDKEGSSSSKGDKDKGEKDSSRSSSDKKRSLSSTSSHKSQHRIKSPLVTAEQPTKAAKKHCSPSILSPPLDDVDMDITFTPSRSASPASTTTTIGNGNNNNTSSNNNVGGGIRTKSPAMKSPFPPIKTPPPPPKDDLTFSVRAKRIEELNTLKKHILAMSDNNKLQQLVDIIEETGNFDVTSADFTFDLCQLDSATIRKIHKFVHSS